jgi:hypothetical protein
MVLGGGKETAIDKSPLLRRYRKVFDHVLRAGGVRILIIGYSFQDAHINKVIWTAAQSFEARLFVWDTKDARQLLKDVRIDDRGRTVDLRPFLRGAASRPLAEVFPRGADPSPEYARIAASFFA